MILKARLVAVAMVAILFGVAGCGGDDNGGGGTTAASTTTAAETIDVSLSDFEIDPPKPRIRKPGQVDFRVKNDGATLHNLEVVGPKGEAVLPANLNPGQTRTLRVDLSKPGNYEWYCPVGEHRDFGMKGQITVAG